MPTIIQLLKRILLLRQISLTFVLIVFSALVWSCGKHDEPGAGSGDNAVGSPIEEVNGRVRFYIAEGSGEARKALGAEPMSFNSSTLVVNGVRYQLKKDAETPYIEVVAKAGNVYRAVLSNENSLKWIEGSSDMDPQIPYSQFWSGTRAAFKDYPLFAEYSPATGNVLKFDDKFSVLELKISGSARISSVKLSSESAPLCGKGERSDREVVVNCTESGKFVSVSGSVSVPVVIRSGDYSGGLELRVCSDDHRMMQKKIPAFSVKPAEVHSESLAWAPDGNLLFFEGFDNFVWGGDIMGGEGSDGWAPDGKYMGMYDGDARDGYDEALNSIAYNYPGGGYIQDNWSSANGSTVGDSHQLSKSYVLSRNIADWTYLFRCQEYHGLLAVGCANEDRGLLQLPPLRNAKGMFDVRLSFKFCARNGFDDDLLIQVANAGHVSNCRIDGRVVPVESGYKNRSGSSLVGGSRFTIPASASAAKHWQEVEVNINGITDASRISLAGNSTSSGVHGFYIDDIAVKTVSGSAKKGNLRLMYMNIQNGMWADQQNNYDNFVAFVKKYDPDICVWCEAASLFKNGSDTYSSSSERFLPNGWSQLIPRYGHSYGAATTNRDGYPQFVSSKYKVNAVSRLGDPVAHGAGHFTLTFNGKKINIVTAHLWPSKSSTNNVSPEDDRRRENEMKYIVGNTVNNPSLSGEEYWILLGDMNSPSPKDEEVYGFGLENTKYLAQKVMLETTSLKDLIADRYPAPQFVASTYGTDRRDYIYLSPQLLQSVTRASVFTDSFTPGTKTGISNFSMPSDHRPFIVDFNL